MYPNLRAEFARKNMTFQIVADALGITVGTLSVKYNGKFGFTLDEAVAIKKLLDVDMPLEVLFEKEQEA